jgi:hypothetical protein
MIIKARNFWKRLTLSPKIEKNYSLNSSEHITSSQIHHVIPISLCNLKINRDSLFLGCISVLNHMSVEHSVF